MAVADLVLANASVGEDVVPGAPQPAVRRRQLGRLVEPGFPRAVPLAGRLDRAGGEPRRIRRERIAVVKVRAVELLAGLRLVRNDPVRRRARLQSRIALSSGGTAFSENGRASRGTAGLKGSDIAMTPLSVISVGMNARPLLLRRSARMASVDGRAECLICFGT